MARILGLDIDEHSVRAAWLSTSFRTAALESLGYADIAPSFDDEGKQLALQEAVREAMGDGRRAPDRIVATLSGTAVSLRAVSLAPGLAGKIGEVLPIEVSELLPFDVDELVVDHQVIRQSPTVLRVLAASTRKESVRSLLEGMRACGAEPQELAAGAAALDGLLGLVPAFTTGGPYLFMHVGSRETDLCVVEDGRCVTARTIAEGAESIDAGQAGRLAIEVARTIAAYRAEGGAELVSIQVTGVRDPRYVASTLESVVSVPIEPFPVPAVPGVDSLALPAFARAIALVGRTLRKGRRFDMRKGEFAPPRAISGLREHRRAIGMGIALVMASFFFSSYVRYSALESEHAALMQRMQQTTRELLGREATSITDARELLAGGTALADPRPRMDAFDILDTISTKVPETIRHQTFRLRIQVDDEARDGTFEISGIVPSIADRDTIASGLEQHECVTQVDRGPTTPAPNNQGQNYRLEGTIQCPGDEPVERRSRGSSSERNP